MAVARKFDVDEASVFVVAEHAQDGDEIEFAFAEHQVLVFAVANVFDVDVTDHVGVLAVDLPERRGLGAEHVADVEREAEARATDVFLQHLELRHVIYEHSRLRLEGELDATTFGVFTELRAAGHQPIPCLMLWYARLRLAGPEADAFSAEFGTDVHRAPQELQTDLSTFGADQRRMMFALRVEQVARASFDGDPQLQFFQELPESHEIGRLRREGIAVVIIECEGDSAVATISDDFERVLEFVVRKPVGVVTETQIHLARLPDRPH